MVSPATSLVGLGHPGSKSSATAIPWLQREPLATGNAAKAPESPLKHLGEHQLQDIIRFREALLEDLHLDLQQPALWGASLGGGGWQATC